MAPLMDHEIPDAISTPTVAWIVISVFLLFATVLGVWICGCCEGQGGGQHDGGRNEATAGGTDPKNPPKHRHLLGGDKDGSGSDSEGESAKSKPSTKTRKAPKVMWSKSTVFNPAPPEPFVRERKKKKKTKRPKNQEEEPAKVEDLKAESQELDSKLPTILRATGLSPPPSLHVPTMIATKVCTIRKTRKAGPDGTASIFDAKTAVIAKTAIAPQTQTQIGGGKTTVAALSTVASKNPETTKSVKIIKLPLKTPDSKRPPGATVVVPVPVSVMKGNPTVRASKAPQAASKAPKSP